MNKKSCVQCHKELEEFKKFAYTEHGDKIELIYYVCTSPKCPNFGLIQMPLEEM